MSPISSSIVFKMKSNLSRNLALHNFSASSGLVAVGIRSRKKRQRKGEKMDAQLHVLAIFLAFDSTIESFKSYAQEGLSMVRNSASKPQILARSISRHLRAISIIGTAKVGCVSSRKKSLVQLVKRPLPLLERPSFQCTSPIQRD